MRLLIYHRSRGKLYPFDFVLNKLKKDALTVFTSFQNKYLKGNSRKSYLLTKSGNALHIIFEKDQLSSRKYEEL